MTTLSDALKVLSDDTRLRMVRLFLYSGEALCVCELVDVLDMPQYQVSRHLAAFKHAGLMSVTKKGTWAYHRLNYNTPLLEALWEFIDSVPLDEETEQKRQRDCNALDLRLALRANGACVVGLSPAAE